MALKIKTGFCQTFFKKVSLEIFTPVEIYFTWYKHHQTFIRGPTPAHHILYTYV